MPAWQYDRLKNNDKAVKMDSEKMEKVPVGEGQGTQEGCTVARFQKKPFETNYYVHAY